MKGIVIYSLGWQRDKHNLSNIDLAHAALRIVQSLNESSVIYCQRTVAAIIADPKFPEFKILKANVIKRNPGYEGSEDLMQQAAESFRAQGITEVISVASPVLHLFKCVQLARKYGFRSPSIFQLIRKIGWIRFDRHSAQPWTRSAFGLIKYTFRQIVFKEEGSADLSEP